MEMRGIGIRVMLRAYTKDARGLGADLRHIMRLERRRRRMKEEIKMKEIFERMKLEEILLSRKLTK